MFTAPGEKLPPVLGLHELAAPTALAGNKAWKGGGRTGRGKEQVRLGKWGWWWLLSPDPLYRAEAAQLAK